MPAHHACVVVGNLAKLSAAWLHLSAWFTFRGGEAQYKAVSALPSVERADKEVHQKWFAFSFSSEVPVSRDLKNLNITLHAINTVWGVMNVLGYS